VKNSDFPTIKEMIGFCIVLLALVAVLIYAIIQRITGG
jgi:hypothetical protein